MVMNKGVELCQSFQFDALTPSSEFFMMSRFPQWLSTACEQKTAAACANDTKNHLENVTNFKQLIRFFFPELQTLLLADASAL